MADVRRFLGCAFASADLLVEVDAEGRITFAAGAAGAAGDPTGQPFATLFVEADRAVVDALLEGLEDGRRAGPLSVAGAEGAPFALGALSAFRLPGFDGRVSCSLTLKPPAASLRTMGADAEGLFSGADLDLFAEPVLDAARASGSALELGLLRFCGLAETLEELSVAEADKLRTRVAGAVRAESWAGSAAARLGPEQFAVLRQPGDTAERTAARLARVVGVAAEAGLTSIDPNGDRALKMLRASVSAFARDNGETAGSDLNRRMEAVIEQAGRFDAIVAEHRFKLAYQPVVRLADGVVHHFETLVRFEGDDSPYDMIRFAEELDIIESLDCAVLEDAVARLRAPGAARLCLAVNVSGRSLASDRFLTRATGLLGPDLAGRLLVELTESSEVDDLDEAAKRLQTLRDRGVGVCLDDFGVGAAAFDYLRRLPVDAVKIDGRYVKEMDTVERSRALVRHVAKLCRELKVETVAEFVETPAIEAALKAAGVDYGQGYLYGAPGPEPAVSQAAIRPAASPVVARRKGVVESWG